MSKLGALSNSQLAVSLNEVVAANKVLHYYTQSIIAQRDIHISALPGLAAHQEMARNHARYWQDNLQPVTKQRISDTTHFFKVFRERLTSVQNLIEQMKDEEERVKNEVVTTIKFLIKKLAIVICGNKEFITKLDTFYSLLIYDERNFNSDLSEAQQNLIGDEEELKELQNQLASIDKSIDRDKALIEGGFLLIWVAVGGAIDLKKQEKAKRKTDVKIAVKRQELVALNAVQKQVNGFVKSVKPSSQATRTLEQGWDALKDD